MENDNQTEEMLQEQSSTQNLIQDDCTTVGNGNGNKKLDKWDKLFDSLLWIIIAVLLCVVIVKTFVFSEVMVSGESMFPTYVGMQNGDAGDTVIVCKIAKPKRGDVAVFYKNEIDSKLKAHFAPPSQCGSGGKYELLIKRVVAVEGDTIWVERCSNNEWQLVVQTSDGTILHEDYYTDKDGNPISQLTMKNLYKLENYTQDNKLTIPQGYFFAMGDNRENSLDSRASYSADDVKLFSFDMVYGKVIYAESAK